MKKIDEEWFIKKWLVTFLLAYFIVLLLWTSLFLWLGLSNWWGWSLAITLVLLAITLYLIVANNVIVKAGRELLITYKGEKCVPLKPGRYLIFPFFGLIDFVVFMDTREQPLCLLLGDETGLDSEIISKYDFGSRSNVDPAKGSDLRLLIRITLQSFDSLLIYYSHVNTLEQLASLAEDFVRAEMRKKENTSQDAIDRNIEDIGVGLLTYLSTVCIRYGYSVVEAKIVDVIYSRKTIEAKESFEVTEIEGSILDKQLENEEKRSKIAIEKARGEQAALNELVVAGKVSMEKAMDYRLRQLTLETVATASKNGSITYIDQGGSNRQSQKMNEAAVLGAGLSFGISNNKNKNSNNEKIF
jgi:hypothetical protein